MNAVPAKAAGVEKLVMVTPAGPDGQVNRTVLAAAHLAGVQEVYRIGGAQAVAALALGTETIPRVDVISGPGNLYVTIAKKLVYGQVGIDSLAGPSEVLVIADGSAAVSQVASDLLAQAEHDPLAAAILLTTSQSLADALPAELEEQLSRHPREAICRQSSVSGDWSWSATASKPAQGSAIALPQNISSCSSSGRGCWLIAFNRQARSSLDPGARKLWVITWLAPITPCPPVVQPVTAAP